MLPGWPHPGDGAARIPPERTLGAQRHGRPRDRDLGTFAGKWQSGHRGEATAAELGDTFEALVRRIRVELPNAVLSTETAYPFEREASEGRDWSTYNDELRERVALLRNLLVGLAMYETLGYEVRTLDVSAAAEVSRAGAALC